ncbi:MAG: FAD-binding oxidoreductase [Desulfobacterales bacterium]|jgi:ferredoxin-NADP reductase
MTSSEAWPPGKTYRTPITHRQWLTENTFTIALHRPVDFQYRAGQRIRIFVEGEARDYSLIPGDTPDLLALLIRRVATGVISAYLADCPLETALKIGGPRGHFIYRPSSRPAVFIATGTGVAPFVAMCDADVKGFVLLHGVREATELYYRDRLEPSAARYIPCLTGRRAKGLPGVYQGRVTTYLQQRLPPGDYDFYLAGRREMIADTIATVDDRFASSRVYSEIFF